MKTRTLIKHLMERNEIRNADMARLLGITPQAMYERTKPTSKKDIGTEQFAKILSFLNYKLVAVPKDTDTDALEGAYEITTLEANTTVPQTQTAYMLTTPDGDVWKFATEDEAKKSRYIFGGKIKKVEVPIPHTSKKS